VSLKTHNFCPSEAKAAWFQASLSSPLRRGTIPAHPSNGFLIHWPSQSKNLLGQNQCVFEIPTLTLYFIFHHGKKDAYILSSSLTLNLAYATFFMRKPMDYLRLIIDASPVVQLVLLILVFFSVFSWAVIFFKRKTLKSASAQSKKFLKVFRRSKDLSEVNQAAKRYKASPLAALFRSGYKELTFLSKSPELTLNSERLESINRALAKTSNQEISNLEKMMSFLATTGSVTPFIGLFGTVWGIMDAFNKIGILRSASIQTVAPGIAEALIATAAGLFAAIPAVIAYNHYLHRIKNIITEIEDFSLEFLVIAERLYGP